MSESFSWHLPRTVLWIALPNIFTVIDTMGSGSSTISVSLASIENIREDAHHGGDERVGQGNITAGPTIMRTEL